MELKALVLVMVHNHNQNMPKNLRYYNQPVLVWVSDIFPLRTLLMKYQDKQNNKEMLLVINKFHQDSYLNTNTLLLLLHSKYILQLYHHLNKRSYYCMLYIECKFRYTRLFPKIELLNKNQYFHNVEV